MANQKIVDLPPLTTVSAPVETSPDVADVFELVDVSDPTDDITGSSKKITFGLFKDWLLLFFQPGHTIETDGTPLPTQRENLNFTGDGVSVADNAGTGATDVNIQNAQVVNLPGDAGVYRDSTGSDPITVNLRPIVAGDASMVVTETADTIELRSLGGGGGGEVNTASNAGTGGVAVTLPKVAFDLPFKSIYGSPSDTALTVVDGGANNRVELAVVQAGISHAALNPSTIGTNSHAAIDGHIGTSSIHFAASTLAGDGIVLNGSALDVVGGEGLTASANSLAVTWAGSGGVLGTAVTVARSDHTHNNLSPTTTLGDMIYNDGVGDTRLPVGVDGQVIVAVGGVPSWGPATGDMSSPVAATASGQLYISTDAAGSQTDIARTLEGAALVGTNLVYAAAELQNGFLAMGGPDSRQLAPGYVHINQVTRRPVGAILVGEMTKSTNTSGDQVEGTNFLADDVALKTLSNTFAALNTFSDAVVVGTPTGGSQGAGTINAEGMFVDGVPVGGGGGGGDMFAPGVIAVGELYMAANTAGTLTARTNIDATAVLLTDAPGVIATGHGNTSLPVASGGTYTPDFTDRNFVTFTGSTATTIGAPSVSGFQAFIFPSGLSVDVSAWIVSGTEGTGARLAQAASDGTTHFWTWVSSEA